MKLASAGLFLLVASLGFAQPTELPLRMSDTAFDNLPPEAKTLVAEARDARDHMNLNEALRLGAQAAEKAPGHAELQFIVLQAAMNRAEHSYGAASYPVPSTTNGYFLPPEMTSEGYYDIAESALQRLQAMSDLSPENQARLGRLLKKFEADRASIADRDKKRLATVLPILLEIRDNRREKMGLTDPEQEKKEALKRAAAAGLLPATAGAEDGGKTTIVDPFSLLPGEAIAPFLPPPPPTAGEGGLPPARDPFSAPVPADPFANGAPPASDPFATGGGEPPPAADPGTTEPPPADTGGGGGGGGNPFE